MQRKKVYNRYQKMKGIDDVNMRKNMDRDYFKLYGEIRRDSSNRITADIRDKEKRKNYVRPDKRDVDIHNKGIEWFKSGLSLEDAPDELRNNSNFLNGFKKGERLALIESLQNDSKKSR